MIEQWKDIPDYEGLYQVSNNGDVKSLSREMKNRFNSFVSKEKVLKKGLSSSGYFTVVLSKNNCKKTIQVHQLIAISFLNHTPNGMKMVIDHIDNNKQNNNVENLRIVTNRFNCYRNQGKYTSLFKGISYVKRKKIWKAQIRINTKVVTIGYFKSEQDAKIAYENKLKTIQ